MDDLQVYFCDLCNTSIPEEDLQAGRALRFKDQRIGACCTDSLKQELAGEAAGRGERSGLFTPVLLLAALAAGVLFLDSRFGEEAAKQRGSLGNVATEVQNITDRAARMETNLAELKSAQSLADQMSRNQSDLLSQELRKQAEQIRGLSAQQDRVEQTLEARIQEVTQRIPDHRSDFAAILSELTAVQARLSALEAAPAADESAPPDFGVPLLNGVGGEPMDGSSSSGLSPELRHHVQRLNDEDAGVRFDAAFALIGSADPKVVSHILGLCKDPDAFVRRLVVEGLAQFPSPEVVEALIVALADPDENVRYSSQNSLKTITGARIEYDPSAPSADRAKGQRRWREWWEANRSRFG